MCIGLNVKCRLLLSDIYENKFLYRFSKNTLIPNFVEIHPVGAELFHADGQTDRQTDMTKLLKSRFAILRNLPKMRDFYNTLIVSAVK